MLTASREVANFKMNERAEWKNAAEDLLELSQDHFDNHRVAQSLKPEVYKALQEQLAKPENLEEQEMIVSILEDLQQKDKKFPPQLAQLLASYK